MSWYEPGPGTSDPAVESWPFFPQKCSSSVLSGHVQPDGKSHADLVVSQAWPLGQCEGVKGGSGLPKGDGKHYCVLDLSTSLEGEILT